MNTNTLRLNYAGAIGLLCQASTEVSEETREAIISAVSDWCDLTGFSYKVIMNRVEVFPPENN